jgi:hypothetical protein
MNGNCVDGYCCNTACTANCQACDVSGQFGKCTTIPAGLPEGKRSCVNSGTLPCGGVCDGQNADCAYAPTTKPCGTTCSSGQLQNSFCDGKGSCNPNAPVTCTGQYACPSGGSACLTSCKSNGDCFPMSGYGCNANSQCKNYCLFDSDTFDDGCIYAP